MLDHINVLNIAVNIPGPLAGAMLRDMGASVTKVEPPAGDPLAQQCSGWYADLVRGVEVVGIDLKDQDQRKAFDTRLADADVLITATRPAALARLGLEWAGLHARFPRLCVVAIVGYPAPRQDVAGHDLTYQAEEGLLAPPSMPRTLVSDLSGAQRAVIAALGLLLSRSRTGEGRRVEVSLSESARFFAEPVARGLTAADGLLAGAIPNYNLYPAREGWVALAALEPHFLSRLQTELGVASIDRDLVAAAFQARTAVEWQQWAESRDLPLVAVR